jgi:hypothetical protein
MIPVTKTRMIAIVVEAEHEKKHAWKRRKRRSHRSKASPSILISAARRYFATNGSIHHVH